MSVPIRMQCDLPAAGASMSFGELLAFVQAVELATDDLRTRVDVVAPPDDAVTTALRVQVDAVRVPPRSPDVRVARDDVIQLVQLLETVEHDDGDARTHLREISELRRRLTELGLQ